MNRQRPKVSIVIPVYNGTTYMKEAIESALAQTYDNIEIIVVNDGSTDNGQTEQIALSYGDSIQYYSKKNGGVSTALNLAIEKKTGDYFSWLSHDDLYHPHKIATQMDYLQQRDLTGKNVILYSNLDVIDKNGVVTSTTGFQAYEPNKKPEYAVLHGLLSGITMLIPCSAFEICGKFDIQYRCVQDYLLFYQFLQHYDYIFLPDVLAATRVHQAQVGQVSPRVMEENNYLWSYMPEHLPLEKKVRLEGSGYDFYLSMAEHIQNFYPYTKASEFCKMKAETSLLQQKAILQKFSVEEIIQAYQAFKEDEPISSPLLHQALLVIGAKQTYDYLKIDRRVPTNQLPLFSEKEPQHDPGGGFTFRHFITQIHTWFLQKLRKGRQL